MQTKTEYRYLINELKPIVGYREAQSMARIVFEDALGIRFPERERELTLSEVQSLRQILGQLKQGEPIQYVLGVAEFYGLQIRVDDSVLIPRPETAELVHWIWEHQRRTEIPAKRLLDIGTGSGCIALALKSKLPEVDIHGWDVSEKALQLARKNAYHLNLKVSFSNQDILDPALVIDQPFDLIVSNPPYITQGERYKMPDHVLDFEPDLALFVTNEDPLQFYKAILAFCTKNLAPNGWLYVELNEYFSIQTQQLFLEAGLKEVEILPDMQGKDRMLRGRKDH